MVNSAKIVDMKEAYENLANAVIVFAAEDYRCVLRHLKKHPERRGLQEEKNRLGKFFHSEWYEMLTDIDGTYLIRKLKEEVGYECDVEVP